MGVGGGDRLSTQLVMTMFKGVDYLGERNVVIDSNQQTVCHCCASINEV